MKRIAFLAALCLLAGCGGGSGDGEAKLGATRPGQANRIVVAALGDSITAGSPSWDPDPGVRRRIGSEALDPESEYEYWAQLRHPQLTFRNCGVFGERTDEIAARLPAC